MSILKKAFSLAIVSGILSGCASLIYEKIYTSSLGADFGKVVTPVGIFVASIVGCLLAAVGFWLLQRMVPKYAEIIFNLLFSILTFATIIGPFAMKMPLDMNSPELLPGMVTPMHFFPALAWFTLRPIFIGHTGPYQKIFAH